MKIINFMHQEGSGMQMETKLSPLWKTCRNDNG